MADGIVLIDKAEGMTSRAVDNALQHRFSTRRVGHLGTLDPFATGLLLLAVGKATKFLPYLNDGKKSYLARLKLGYRSSTGDPTGEIVKADCPSHFSAEQVRSALSSFLGKSMQVPPMQSAIKKDGVPLYRLAHRGESVERAPREIEVSRMELLRLEGDEVDFLAEVSKGTYIRVLGEDIAKRLGSEGYLLSLRRLSIGPYGLAGAKRLEEVGEGDLREPTPYVVDYPHVGLTDEESEKAKNGLPLDLGKDYGAEVLLTSHLVGIAIYERGAGTLYRAKRGLF